MISQSEAVRATAFSTGFSKVTSRPAISVTVKESSAAGVFTKDTSSRAAKRIANSFLSFMTFSPFCACRIEQESKNAPQN